MEQQIKDGLIRIDINEQAPSNAMLVEATPEIVNDTSSL